MPFPSSSRHFIFCIIVSVFALRVSSISVSRHARDFGFSLHSTQVQDSNEGIHDALSTESLLARSALTEELSSFASSLDSLADLLNSILNGIQRLRSMLGFPKIPISPFPSPEVNFTDPIPPDVSSIIASIQTGGVLPSGFASIVLGDGGPRPLLVSANRDSFIGTHARETGMPLQTEVVATELGLSPTLPSAHSSMEIETGDASVSDSMSPAPSAPEISRPTPTGMATVSSSQPLPLSNYSTDYTTRTSTSTRFVTTTTILSNHLPANLSLGWNRTSPSSNNLPRNVSVDLNSTSPVTNKAPSNGSWGFNVTSPATVSGSAPRPSGSVMSIAVYFGQQSSQASDLLTLCANPSVDIIALAFLNSFSSNQGSSSYPSTAFGGSCDGPNPTQERTAPGLQDCSRLGEYITQCQQRYNTKVLVSLGGYIASSSFSSADEASRFAEQLWNLFGAGTGEDPQLRPFGDAIVDGFDDDNEDHSTQYWSDFATALRSQYSKDPSRKYYLSAAPQCPRPDQSIPSAVLDMADFVFVQFYNNAPCNIGTSGFIDSIKAWSDDLLAGSSSSAASAKLFLGVPSWDGGGSGYLPSNQLQKTIAQVRQLNLPNLGGVMMWDGTRALSNLDADGQNFLVATLNALNVQ